MENTDKEVVTEQGQPSYAFLISPFGDDKKLNEMARKESCQTCGYPGTIAGDMCPKCTAKLEEKNNLAMAATLEDFLSPRWVHSSTHGWY